MGDVVVAVVGSGGPDVDVELIQAAGRIGRGLADAGVILVCGGLGGVMAAAAEGARAAGGVTLGLLPGTDRAAANPHVAVPVATGLGEARNTLVVRTADAVVAVGGGYGTLSEIGFALKTGTPVIGYRTWTLHRNGDLDSGIQVVASSDEAVAQALRAAGVA